MLVYAGTSPEDEIPDGSKYYMIMADLKPGIGHEIYFSLMTMLRTVLLLTLWSAVRGLAFR